MEKIDTFINEKLEERVENSSLRTLTSNKDLVDFYSNDYLGFSRSPSLKTSVVNSLALSPDYPVGSTGSRLLSGNDPFTESIEDEIAIFHKSDKALIFNSGYDANLGLFSSIAQRGDTIILDEFIHASIIDGARLSNANRFSFKHNDLISLEQKLKLAKGKVFIGVESIYSMDGDEAPLIEIVQLAEKYSAALIVDEAHAIGIFGNSGRGLIEKYNLQNNVLARVITFGKALGCHGAAILCKKNLHSYLINFARSFIYTTAASFFTHQSIKSAYKQLSETDHKQIHSKIRLFKNEIKEINSNFIQSNSPIQCLTIGGNLKAKEFAGNLFDKGFNVRAILHPTVPVGQERLRICLHTFNTDLEIKNLIKAIKNIL